MKTNLEFLQLAMLVIWFLIIMALLVFSFNLKKNTGMPKFKNPPPPPARKPLTTLHYENNYKCVDYIHLIPKINNFDLLMAREFLLKGDSLNAVHSLLLYINKTESKK